MVRRPEIKKDPLYLLLREGKVEEFNQRKARGETFDLTYCDFRGLDLRGMDTTHVDFGNSYFRQTDLRGLDLSSCNLAGVSLNGAKISGTLFPDQYSADEIVMSLQHGTRLRPGANG